MHHRHEMPPSPQMASRVATACLPPQPGRTRATVRTARWPKLVTWLFLLHRDKEGPILQFRGPVGISPNFLNLLLVFL